MDEIDIVPYSKAYKNKEAICFSCQNCNPFRCEWVNKLKVVWRKAIKIEHSVRKQGPPEIKYRVIGCAHYKAIERKQSDETSNTGTSEIPDEAVQ